MSIFSTWKKKDVLFPRIDGDKDLKEMGVIKK